MRQFQHVEELDRVPVGRRVRDARGMTWEHVRESQAPWESVEPAWVVVEAPAGEWHPGAVSDTMHLLFAYGPFFYTECGGRDPAYPGLTCYLDSGHLDECEFTDARGREWRRRAMVAEEQVKAWQGYFHINTDHWRDTLEYAVVALEGSDDRGDLYCAAQIKAALAGATT